MFEKYDDVKGQFINGCDFQSVRVRFRSNSSSLPRTERPSLPGE